MQLDIRIRATAKRMAPLCLSFLLVLTAAAQDEEQADTVTYPVWENDMSARLSGSQAGYQNWTEGGISSVAGTALLNGTFQRTSANWLQVYETRLGLGVVKQDTLAFRKAEDVIRLKAQVSYQGDTTFRKYSPTAAAGLRTQFAPGFNYDKNPFDDDEREPPVQVSDLFSPGILTQSLGFAYNSSVGFRQRIGIAAKETIILKKGFRPLYGQAPGEAVRFQLGVESQTELDREIFENVHVKSSLGLFAAFNQEELPDILWENVLTLGVNDWLSANVEVVALYDRDISDVVQLKEVFSLGISIVII